MWSKAWHGQNQKSISDYCVSIRIYVSCIWIHQTQTMILFSIMEVGYKVLSFWMQSSGSNVYLKIWSSPWRGEPIWIFYNSQGHIMIAKNPVTNGALTKHMKYDTTMFGITSGWKIDIWKKRMHDGIASSLIAVYKSQFFIKNMMPPTKPFIICLSVLLYNWWIIRNLNLRWNLVVNKSNQIIKRSWYPIWSLEACKTHMHIYKICNYKNWNYKYNNSKNIFIAD